MKSSPGRWRLATAAIAATIPFAAAQSQAEPATAELHQRIEELSQKLLVLERKLELQDETAQAAARSTPVVKASPKGFSLQSADSQNVVKLRGTLHFDGRRFTDDVTTETSDTWLLRRVRPTLEGTLGGIYDFRFTPDFAGGRTIILSGDACYLHENLERGMVSRLSFNVGQATESLQRIADLIRDGAEIIIGHDPDQWRRIPQAPVAIASSE